MPLCCLSQYLAEILQFAWLNDQFAIGQVEQILIARVIYKHFSQERMREARSIRVQIPGYEKEYAMRVQFHTTVADIVSKISWHVSHLADPSANGIDVVSLYHRIYDF